LVKFEIRLLVWAKFRFFYLARKPNYRKEQRHWSACTGSPRQFDLCHFPERDYYLRFSTYSCNLPFTDTVKLFETPDFYLIPFPKIFFHL
jgi:hypothetical protein